MYFIIFLWNLPIRFYWFTTELITLNTDQKSTQFSYEHSHYFFRVFMLKSHWQSSLDARNVSLIFLNFDKFWVYWFWGASIISRLYDTPVSVLHSQKQITRLNYGISIHLNIILIIPRWDLTLSHHETEFLVQFILFKMKCFKRCQTIFLKQMDNEISYDIIQIPLFGISGFLCVAIFKNWIVVLILPIILGKRIIGFNPLCLCRN